MMKNKLQKIVFSLNLMAIISIHQVKAQNDVAVFLKGGINDANILANAYFNPLVGGFAASLNNGWYNTAKPHGTGGFDITGSVNFITINQNQKSFNLEELGLNTTKGNKPYYNFNGQKTAPTVYGTPYNGKEIELRQQFDPNNPATDTVITKFSLPDGQDLPIGFGLPSIQLAVGIVKKTELIIRLVPSITSNNFKVNMFGLGVKHDVSQWIWGVNKVPVSISAIAAFNSMNATVAFGDHYLKPEFTGNGALSNQEYKNSQHIDIAGSGFMIGGIVSKKLLFFTPYLGVNYSTSNINVAMKGIYPVTFFETNPSDPNFGKNKVINVNDPIEIKQTINSVRATLGTRLHLGVITIHGDYTLSEISMFNIGLGINIQSLAPFKLM